MIKNPRKLVTGHGYERPFPTWPEVLYFVLECGHRASHAGWTVEHHPKRMACPECRLTRLSAANGK